MAVLLWLLDAMFVVFISLSYFALYNTNRIIISQEFQHYQKNNIIFYTKTYWQSNNNYCLNKFDFNFYSCNLQSFKNNKDFISFVDNTHSQLYYKNPNWIIDKTTIK